TTLFPEALNATRPPVPRHSRPRNPVPWLITVTASIALFGIMAICVFGIVKFWPLPHNDQIATETLKLTKLSQKEFDARALIIPFEKLGTPKRLYEIEMVQIKGKVKFADPFNKSDFLLTWESLN